MAGDVLYSTGKLQKSIFQDFQNAGKIVSGLLAFIGAI